VQLYRGEITADSEPGKGTRFTVELPVSLDLFEEEEYELVSESLEPDFSVIQEENEGTSNIESEHNTTKNGEVILIVEDQADLREFIATNLSKDYRILEASDGEEGISKATKEIPDLIITDVMMPKVDGNELTRSLKNNENTSHIPIIMLTAKSSVESKIEGLENEADDYLTKPFNITELQLRIKNILKSRHKLQEKYNKSITVNPSEITTTSVDEKFLSKLLKIVEDNMSNSGFSVEFLCDAVGMSRANIHKKLKQLLNQSATEFINSVRLKRAAQLIRKNTGNISEIAYDVGYNNLSYFSRAFKKHFNMTPKEMMEKNK
jgi:YesN/AraC family two-component response regulator